MVHGPCRLPGSPWWTHESPLTTLPIIAQLAGSSRDPHNAVSRQLAANDVDRWYGRNAGLTDGFDQRPASATR